MDGIDYTQSPVFTLNPTKTGVECMHYGKYVDSDIAIVGVVATNNVLNMDDDWERGISMAWESHKRECRRRNHDQCFMPDGTDDVVLIGSWKLSRVKCDDGKRRRLYVPDKNGEYAATVAGPDVVVHWSKHTQRHGLCSPCFAGCADIDSDGQFLCYVLPPDVMRAQDYVVEEVVVSMCPACGGANSAMGKLGNLSHFRCQDCGMEYSRDTP